MNHALHFIRPGWLLLILPLLVLAYILFRQKPIPHTWQKACDTHLLPHLIQIESFGAQKRALFYLLSAAFFMILALSGPALKKLPRPTYHAMHPRLVIMDLSPEMQKKDLKPNRLTRAKFKLHDLFQAKDKGQFGLIVYTGEPFVVSPLTFDASTIDALVNQLTLSIMPVGGQNLPDALKAGEKLLKQANAPYGDILVLTGTAPSKRAIKMAEKLSKSNIHTSILALTPSRQSKKAFQTFAARGQGKSIPFSHTDKDIQTWLAMHSPNETFQINQNNALPLWRDDGRWLLIPALFCLIPVFRRAWLIRIST